MTSTMRILDQAPTELMIVEDVTGDGDPYNSASSRRRKVQGACEFVRSETGRHYVGDRLPGATETSILRRVDRRFR